MRIGLTLPSDEFEAAGADQKICGARADEFLAALKAIWSEDPAEFHGKYLTLPRSIIGAKPVQKPHPRSIRSSGAKTRCEVSERLDAGRHPARRHGSHDWENAPDGKRSRARSASTGSHSRRQHLGHGETLGRGSRDLHWRSRASEKRYRSDQQLGADEIFFMIFSEGSMMDLLADMVRFRALA